MELDTVTNLYDYSYFQECSMRMIQTDEQHTRYCILYTDFLNFKILNRMYGFQEGNRMLMAYAQFLTNLEGEGMAARVFSDYFVTVFKISEDESCDLLAKLIEKQMKVFLEQQQSYHPQCNLQIAGGVCEVLNGYQGFVTAVDNANSARKVAKKSFRTQIIFFDHILEKKIEHENLLAVAISLAIDRKQIQFYLQPKVNLMTGKIIGAEALARWIREDNTMVSPVDFIPLMERDGSIVRSDFLIYEQVCCYLKEQLAIGSAVVPISVNVSRVHLQNAGFAKDVHELVKHYQIPPQLLEFELTENIFINDLDEALSAMKELRHYGYLVSVDDFGSGYSSLNLLRKLDFDILKLDKSFLDDRGADSEKNAVIVSNVVKMAYGLHTQIICEGVETLDHVKFLKNLGCGMAQGFYFSKPVSKDMFLERFHKNHGYYSLP